MANRRTATPAEINLVQLRNCLVNLPPSLAGLLVNSNTAAQNCIVELQYRIPGTPSVSSIRSVYLGWTGFSSKSKPSLAPGRRALREPNNSSSSTGPISFPTVEIDASFAHTLDIPNGARVGVVLHPDPSVAHTVHIEPLTPADWEIIELHATFLETNLLAQIRALPNPLYIDPSAHKPEQSERTQQVSHPLTIHLSPTSTANVLVTQLIPAVAKSVAFAKIGSDAEVIVAPKTRNHVATKSDSKSIVSGSVRSGKTSGPGGQKGQRLETKPSLFVRGVNERIISELNDVKQLREKAFDLPVEESAALSIWIDAETLLDSRGLNKSEWVAVSVVVPAGLQVPLDAQQMQTIKEIEGSEAGAGAQKIVARIVPCHSLPVKTCAILSSSLCVALGHDDLCSQMVRIEPAPLPISEVRTIKVYPLSSPLVTQQMEGLKFGGETRASRDIAVKRFVTAMGRSGPINILNGPLTDGMLIPASTTKLTDGWNGGIIRLTGRFSVSETEKSLLSWVQAKETDLNVELQSEITRPEDPRKSEFSQTKIMLNDLKALVGVDRELDTLKGLIQHGSSVLLCGGQGSGRTVVSKTLARFFQSEKLYNVLFLSCAKLVTDETRTSVVKDLFHRLFMRAAWGTRLGGRSLIILDDLDKICPAEQELQVGNDNARSRQVSELLSVAARRFCKRGSGVTLVATSRGKDSLHPVIAGGHILPETIELTAPTKARRRAMLATLLQEGSLSVESVSLKEMSARKRVNGSTLYHETLTTTTDFDQPSPDSTKHGIDLLTVAGRTDGYMPGDLVLLVLRARSEAINRVMLTEGLTMPLCLNDKDFERALDGFTPASLRNVTLQSSSTTFSTIGGLRETRKILLETLQYPTTYAPIFAQCPLRLRSGLLLYGYPGCGKTLLASAVAGECGLNFISVKGPEILNKYIGASEKSVRDLFERAQAAKPCVLFFDEFDSIAPKRGHDSTGVTDRVVNQMLTQMDGAEGLSGVYVLAATSRPDLIDPALLRPGRLDKSLLCDMPNQEDRVDILKALSSKLKVANSIVDDSSNSTQSLHEVARRTDGFSGADLQAVIYNAHLEAIHDVLETKSPVNGVRPSDGMKAVKQNTRQNLSFPGSSADHELVKFRYGIEEDKDASAATTGSKAVIEHLTLMNKLEMQRQAKRRERDVRRGMINTPKWQQHNAGANDLAHREETEVVIMWRHIEKSLISTRNSISAGERSKLEAIYNEFVRGRNGEMPSGQGPTEIGARSSLM